jgi:hypothetical protein
MDVRFNLTSNPEEQLEIELNSDIHGFINYQLTTEEAEEQIKQEEYNNLERKFQQLQIYKAPSTPEELVVELE